MTSRSGFARQLLESSFLNMCFTDLKSTAFKSFSNAKTPEERESIHSDMQALIRLERYLLACAQDEEKQHGNT
jgi:hypothetical protein